MVGLRIRQFLEGMHFLSDKYSPTTISFIRNFPMSSLLKKVNDIQSSHAMSPTHSFIHPFQGYIVYEFHTQNLSDIRTEYQGVEKLGQSTLGEVKS